MTHIQLAVLAVLAVFASFASVGVSNAQPRALAPYADYVTYVTTFQARTTGNEALAIAREDPSGVRCFAHATSRSERDVCQRFLQEVALVEAMPTIAIAARAKLILDADPNEPSRTAMLPLGQACAESAERLAETGIAPLRKIGPYTIGLLKSKLCNALLVSASERVSVTEH